MSDGVEDESAVVTAVCDSLHTLAQCLHDSRSFGLLVRLSDKRVLATTCDHEIVDTNNDVFDDASTTLSYTIANLTGKRLPVRSSETSLLDALSNADETNGWLEECKRKNCHIICRFVFDVAVYRFWYCFYFILFYFPKN